jgi:Zn-dependent peptidase ImmA (M78 family)/DNA-binding XRE family transcriptional regulator
MESNILNTTDMHALGQKLQEARKNKGLTQEAVASQMGVTRTTITAIEKGERRVKADELIRLAQLYGRQVNDFLRPRPPIESFLVQFRGPIFRTPEDEKTIEPHIEQLEDYCRDYLELEKLIGTPLVRRYPAEYRVDGLPIEQAAEGIALEERNRLGLGDGPIHELRDILEQDVGLRIFYFGLPSKFSEIYIYTETLGGCMAINAQQPEERCRWSMAHAYGHFLTSRAQPRVDLTHGYERKPESERLADAFAISFLMPLNGLTRRFNDIRRTTGRATPADLLTLAHFFGVSAETLTRRLESLKLIPTGTWDRLRDRGFKIRQAQQQLELESVPARNETFPIRYRYLAAQAYESGLISEGQFARLLHVDRVEARLIAETLQEDAADVLAGDAVLSAPEASAAN